MTKFSEIKMIRFLELVKLDIIWLNENIEMFRSLNYTSDDMERYWGLRANMADLGSLLNDRLKEKEGAVNVTGK